jgi:hypothetical protein
VTVKALTLTQPWAAAVAAGVKHVETRSWSTNYRGPLAIHAAKGMTAGDLAFAHHLRGLELLPEATVIALAARPDLSRGVVIARCVLVDVVPVRLVVALTTEERLLGDYSPGRYAWILEDIEPIDPPVPARGRLGLWTWEEGAQR